MRSALYRSDPRLSAALHGFYEFSSNGQFILGHGGSTVWFQSLMMLLPEQDLGIFISTNSTSGSAVHSGYRKAFLDRYFPDAGQVSSASFTPTSPDSVAGTYASLRSSFTDFTELGRIMAPLVVAENREGGLVVTGLRDRAYFDEIDSGLYHDKLSGRILAFRFDESGTANHLFFATAPSATFERLPWYHHPSLLQALLALSSLFIGWALIVWPLQALYSTKFREYPEARYRRAGWILAATSGLLSVALITATTSPDELVFGITPGVQFILMANYAIPVLSLWLASRLPALWRSNSVGRWEMMSYLGVLLAGMLNSAMLFDWHMFYGL
jgi:hypothetical protein